MNGLLKVDRGKGNIERIEEAMSDFEYHHYHHFISNSPWAYEPVLARVREDANEVMRKEREKKGVPTGYIIDESSHLKRGTHSVGVARQYAGVIGKVENCQVGVYASLCTGNRSCLIDERLYLPGEWIADKQRCDKAKLPDTEAVFKTKPELALEMIDSAVAEGIHFDWIGGDGLYGHTYELSRALDRRNLLFVLDVHKNQQVYLSEPVIDIPEKSAGRGRPPSRPHTSVAACRVDAWVATLSRKDWRKVKIRRTAKGYLYVWMHICTVWTWNGEENAARKRTLVVRQDIDKKGRKGNIKYSLSNGSTSEYTTKQFAYFQAQRYWVERDFQSAKSELGMSDYQIRKWISWHHHHAIVFMAMIFNLKDRIRHEVDYPLMSVRDSRILVTTLIAESVLEDEPELLKELRAMRARHQKRQADIDRHYRDPG